MTIKEDIPRPEYPRPQFVREGNWLNLNGKWGFSFDDKDVGLSERWFKPEKKDNFDLEILVPFCFQSQLSGIGDKSFHDVIWYRKAFLIPPDFFQSKILLHFGAVDYECRLYINGEFAGSHKGGYTPFSLDITNFVKKENVIVLRVEDPSNDTEIPRGKQFWEVQEKIIFYPRVSGIWQTVWLESVNPRNHIRCFKITSDIDNSLVIIECEITGTGSPNLFLNAKVLDMDLLINEVEIKLNFLGNKLAKRRGKALVKEKRGFFEKMWKYIHNPNKIKFKIEIPKDKLNLWDVENPHLYDLVLEIIDRSTNTSLDTVRSYFGMRKISISKKKAENPPSKIPNRQVLLNNKPIYQKLFLVQGYWQDGLYTAPDEEDIIKDVKYIKRFGFNGLRTHQKAFDPRFLYWCDKEGILVWGEMGNAFMFSQKSQLNLINQYTEMIDRDFNHPSIIAWVLLNEGWGVNRAEQDERMVNYTAALYYLFKSIDPTRMIIDDDGWWHTKTDLCTKHFYLDLKHLPKTFQEEKNFTDFKPLVPKFYLDSYEYKDEPIIYSEIGGYGLDLNKEHKKAFCQGKVNTSEELFQKVVALLRELDRRKSWIHGFCYTELYDQFQEINGLLTMKREPKYPPEDLKKEMERLFY